MNCQEALICDVLGHFMRECKLWTVFYSDKKAKELERCHNISSKIYTNLIKRLEMLNMYVFLVNSETVGQITKGVMAQTTDHNL